MQKEVKRLRNPRQLVVSLVAGVVIGVLAGLAHAVLAHARILDSVGKGLLVTGLAALVLALVGATEPRRPASPAPRGLPGSFIYVVHRHPLALRSPSIDFVVWGIVVGGGLVGLSAAVFWALP